MSERPVWIHLGLVLLAIELLARPALGQVVARGGQFTPGSVQKMEDLPQGRFRQRLEELPAAARLHALEWLRDFHFTELDLDSLHADDEGGIYYADTFSLSSAPIPSSAPPVTGAAAVPVSPFPANLVFHSRPGAPNVLYINFAGETVSGTAWNSSLGRSSISAVAFSTDADYSTFSDAEQLAIKRIWQRMSEDYAPFNIDVTTERPATFTTRTAHALITRSTDVNGNPNPASTAGGVAYVNVFGSSSYASYRPAWIYFNNLAYNESYIAEAASHEIGHNMGLSHDGRTDGYEYYGGHGSGDTSWGPLMGTGYDRNVSQWSKGEYYLANNTEDDLAIISGKISYRTDDHGNTVGTATSLVVTGVTNIVSTTPETDPTNLNPGNKGVLERNNDVDVFSFTTGSGNISLAVKPWISPSGNTRGGNLDILLELRDGSGNLLLTNNPSSLTTASIQTNLPEGAYYLFVRNAGAGDPFSSAPSGYTAYGSIGQYFISGYVVPSGYVAPPIAEATLTNVTHTGVGLRTFAVTYSDNLAINVASLDDFDIRVVGPNGYDHAAQFVSVNSTVNGSPRVATYSVPPPNGNSWTAADNGNYSVWMQTNQVSDTEGAAVAPGLLGEFVVQVPVAIYTANMDADPGWTLSAQWQYGIPSYGSSGPAAGFTGSKILGYNLSGNYGNNLATAYATTPAINCSGASGLSLHFHRWLRLKSQDSASIEVSTNGSTWSSIWSTKKSVTDTNWVDLQYTLPAWTSGANALRLRWGIGSGQTGNDIGWNLDDVELIASGVLDTAPPTAVLNVANITSAGSPSHSLTVNYSDDSGVDVASLGGGDLLVTGPNDYSNLVEFVSVDTPSDGSPRTATYSIPAPGGDWDVSDNGTYQVIILDGEVSDVLNNATAQSLLGSFAVAIPDNQQALIISTSLLTVPEGSNAVFTVRLADPPTTNLTVTVSRISGDADLFVQSGSTIGFNASNWSIPVPVTIAALVDADQANDSAIFQCVTPGLPIVTVSATEQDNTPDVTLTTGANMPAWGSVSPPSGSYPLGAGLQVTAIPAPYFQFSRWTGDITGAENPLSLVLTSNLTVQAVFAEMLTTNHSTPYWWLASYGFTNNFEMAATNLGVNGMPLWQSYIAGLNPNDPKSQLRLSGKPMNGGSGVVLSWSPVAGRVYSVWSSVNLSDEFAPLPEAINLPDYQESFTNQTPNSASLFYRLQVEKP